MQRIPRVDCGYASFLPVCGHCPWRGLPRASRDAAALVADRHAISIHGDRSAMAATTARERRAS